MRKNTPVKIIKLHHTTDSWQRQSLMSRALSLAETSKTPVKDAVRVGWKNNLEQFSVSIGYVQKMRKNIKILESFGQVLKFS